MISSVVFFLRQSRMAHFTAIYKACRSLLEPLLVIRFKVPLNVPDSKTLGSIPANATKKIIKKVGKRLKRLEQVATYYIEEFSQYSLAVIRSKQGVTPTFEGKIVISKVIPLLNLKELNKEIYFKNINQMRLITAPAFSFILQEIKLNFNSINHLKLN